jgi:hypothetical protein
MMIGLPGPPSRVSESAAGLKAESESGSPNRRHCMQKVKREPMLPVSELVPSLPAEPTAVRVSGALRSGRVLRRHPGRAGPDFKLAGPKFTLTVASRADVTACHGDLHLES